MPFQKVEYKFPDEDTNDNKNENDTIEVEKSSAVEIDISGKASATDGESKEEKGQTKEKVETKESNYEIEVINDVPKADRGRKPSEPPADITEEELGEYEDEEKEED